MANSAPAHSAHGDGADGETRRDFLLHMTVATGVVGTAMMVWPLIHSMNPAQDTLSMSTTEFSIAGLAEGQSITVVWRGKPVFVRNRTKADLEAAKAVDVKELRDPQTDAERTKKGHEAVLIVVGVCTHLGCIPLGQKPADPRGEFHGWFCPCHGSAYDTSGRIRKGPAPKNLEVPPYTYVNDTTVRIG
jgi:ubiquinol-cytochrome c reductase iron-sulfur subunit